MKALLALVSPLLPIIWIWGGGGEPPPPAFDCADFPTAIYCDDFETATANCDHFYTSSPSDGVNLVCNSTADPIDGAQSLFISNTGSTTATCKHNIGGCWTERTALTTYCTRFQMKVGGSNISGNSGRFLRIPGSNIMELYQDSALGLGHFFTGNPVENFTDYFSADDTVEWVCWEQTIGFGQIDSSTLYKGTDCGDIGSTTFSANIIGGHQGIEWYSAAADRDVTVDNVVIVPESCFAAFGGG